MSEKNLDIAVECKNYDSQTVVGIKEIGILIAN